jgi:protein-L-isoaspartate(D-aspartate) O-methyltransferase
MPAAPTSTSPISSTATTIPQEEPTLDPYASQRLKLVEQGIQAYGVEDPLVLEAMRKVPRHEFVPEEYRDLAYLNNPLPIGYGQTISQPYIVGLMTQELNLETGQSVLEIGTGSGYQAAVLAELGYEVYSIEIIEPLYVLVVERLSRLGYDSISLLNADGYYGWEEAAPFDAILVTAAPDHVPQPLLSQLKVGGVMVIPVGPVGGFQELWQITRIGIDEYETRSLGGVRFVPFTRSDDS